VAEEIRVACRLDDRPIQIIPYPIDTDEFRPEARKDDSPKSVLFAGRLEEHKGADVLLKAIPRVLAKHPDCQFVFVGTVSTELENEVKAASSSARFQGFTIRQEVVPLYQKASVFVAPSMWDNSPNTIYEAMACGTPVVATRVGGIPELVEDGITGLLVAPSDVHALADAIIALLDNPARRSQMGYCARAKAVGEFAVEKIAGETLALYGRVTKSK
jgi:starch synthase